QLQGNSLDVGLQAAARQMATKSAALRDAPPIRPPLMSGCENRTAALSGLTLPPYRICISSDFGVAPCNWLRISACPACACSGVAVLPVPMAHTGSYATTICEMQCPSVWMTADIWRLTTVSVR